MKPPPPPPFPNNSSSQNSKEHKLSTSSSWFSENPPLMSAKPPKMPKNKEIIPVDVIDVDEEDACNNVVFIPDDSVTNDKGKGIYHHNDHQWKSFSVDVIDVDEEDACNNVVFIRDDPVTNDKGKGIYHHNDHQLKNLSLDVDKDEACDNAMFVHGKGKGICHHSDHQMKKILSSHSFSSDVEILESGNEVEYNFPSSSHDLIELDNLCSDLSTGDDEWIPFDETGDMDDYSALQAHFDYMDIPPGIEAPIPWMPLGQNGKKASTEPSSLLAGPQINPGSSNELGKSPAYLKLKVALANSLNLSDEINALDHPPEGIEPFASFPLQDIQQNKKSASFRYSGKFISPNEVSYIKSLPEEAKARFLDHFMGNKRKQYGSTNISINQSDAMKLHNGGETSDTSHGAKKKVGSHNMLLSNISGYMDNFKHQEAGLAMPYWQEYAKMKNKDPLLASHIASGLNGPFNPFGSLGEVVDMPWVQDSTRDLSNLPPGDLTSVASSPADVNDFLRNFEMFKQFDTVDDHSDHYYSGHGSCMKQASKKWTKKIQEEWKILEKDLPETIFVRVYESRMDLMRAVIIGPEGTPYHDGLFFFDIFFPSDYPNLPPRVYYHSGGLRLNPNLYESGKVCLSLLNTWSGKGNEMWVPDMSTMLQVLVSIQGLILNTKPYFNEPGYEYQNGSATGEKRSQQYNEETFILSIKTMVYNIRRPIKHFEDFVKGHFYKRAHDILGACKAYTDGAQVGSLVKGMVQDLDMGDKSCTKKFKLSLDRALNMLVDAFKRMGISDCEKFLPARSPPDTKCNQATRWT